VEVTFPACTQTSNASTPQWLGLQEQERFQGNVWQAKDEKPQLSKLRRITGLLCTQETRSTPRSVPTDAPEALNVTYNHPSLQP
jgi:hypothetical protein